VLGGTCCFQTHAGIVLLKRPLLYLRVLRSSAVYTDSTDVFTAQPNGERFLPDMFFRLRLSITCSIFNIATVCIVQPWFRIHLRAINVYIQVVCPWDPDAWYFFDNILPSDKRSYLFGGWRGGVRASSAQSIGKLIHQFHVK
jgi:hypothetical protein